MTNRARPMPDYYVRSVILAELRRARAANRHIDRNYLRSETGVGREKLERAISKASRELDQLESAAEHLRRTEGGAKPGPGPSPKGRPDPFAPPTTTGKAKP